MARAESMPSEPPRRPVSSCSIIAHMVMEFDELGRRIADARRDSGLTQQACASLAQLRRDSLAKIETGTRRVSALELARLAAALDMRISWFFEDPPPAVVSRRGAAEPGTPLQSIDRYVELLTRETMFLRTIVESFDLPASPDLPAPTGPEEAERLATDVRHRLGYQHDQPAIDLVEKAPAIGLLIFSLACGPGSADGASILLDRGGVAVVNGDRHLGRRRLTAAHEIGHFIVADEYSTDWDVTADSRLRTEALIDHFARALLLPAEAVRSRWHGGADTREDAVLIGAEFRVDMSTLARRLTELELASPDETAEVRATVTRSADIVEYNLFVPRELEPPGLPRPYVKAVLDAYRGREVSGARALSFLLDTWVEEDLPELPMLPAEAIWSFVS